MKNKIISDKKYAIITHRLFTGAGQDLYRFLKKNNTNYVLLVQHSFSSTPNRKTTFTEFKNKKESFKDCLDYKFLPYSIVYIKDFLYSIFGIFLNKNKFDLIVGCGGFNALSALLLRRLGKTKKTIFYTIDYTPKRFDNPFLNKAYHLIDKICVKHCDQTWNLSPRMAKGREKYNNMPINKYKRQKVVPIGIWLEDIPKVNKKYKRKTLVFVGHLLEKQGIQLVLKAIPKTIKKIKDLNFIIVGTGGYETELKKLVSELNINKYVNFTGAIHDPEKLYKILCKCHLAVAVYKKEKASHVYYADPTKLKTYFAVGLPIILTNIAHNAKEIEIQECGKIVNYDTKSTTNAIIELMKSEEKLKKHSENTKKYVKQFDWNKIFTDVLDDIWM